MEHDQLQPHERSDLRVGDLVSLTGLPPWVGQMPTESQRVFQPCVGGTFRVRALRTPPGDVELWVRDGADYSTVLGDSIWIEPVYLQRVPSDHTPD